MCYHNKEVNIMDMENMENIPQEQQPYSPRPRWQVWMARVALAVFILLLVMYYINVFRGGA